MLVGEENEGWKLITTQLNHERVMLGPAGRLEGLRDRVAAWAEAHGVARRARRTPTARRGDGDVPGQRAAQLGGRPAPPSRATITRGRRVGVQGLRLRPRAAPRPGLAEVVHRYGDPADPETGELVDYLDAQAKRNLVLTFGGGVNEVQRELIAHVRARTCRGCPDERRRHDRIMAEAERIKATRRDRPSAPAATRSTSR